MVAGVIGGLIANALNSPATSSTTGPQAASAATSCSVTRVANKVLPSVVTVTATGSGDSGGDTGSGTAIRGDYILTNNHVISVAANGGRVDVLFAGGQTEPATIVGRDRLTDLAVLKVRPTSELRPATMGSAKGLKIGEPVVAVGSPLGLAGTITAGIVSALDRTIEVPGEKNGSALLVSAVQTDAAINPGNSGGALVDCKGDLVGVPTATASVPNASGPASAGSVGLGFAIPINLASTIANEIIKTGRVRHAFFGLQTVAIPKAAASESGVYEGLYVATANRNGPSFRAGMRDGDIITSIDGQRATTNNQLAELTVTKQPGDTVTIDYERDHRSLRAKVTLGVQP